MGLPLYDRISRELDDDKIVAIDTAQAAPTISFLNHALATELVCMLRYKRHYYVASGIKAEVIAAELKEHAEQELNHADRIAERITQLGGEPDYSPNTLLDRSHAKYTDDTSLVDMVRENLIAERIAVETYRDMIQKIGDRDPTTRRLLEDILAEEEEHADDMSAIYFSLRESDDNA